MTKRFFKHKILLDENVHYRNYFPLLNSLFDVKHITEDYNQIGLPDPEVYKLATRLERIVQTSVSPLTLVNFPSSDFSVDLRKKAVSFFYQ